MVLPISSSQYKITRFLLIINIKPYIPKLDVYGKKQPPQANRQHQCQRGIQNQSQNFVLSPRQ